MALPEPLPLGFVTLRPRLGDAGLAELVLQAADHPFTDDGVTKMTDYIDDFLKYDLVKKGFSIVYDLRSLRVPSLSLVKQLADWGRDPERQQTFQRMNKICKVVVSEGWRFGVAKRILSAFFAMCPPVCDTFLLTAAWAATCTPGTEAGSHQSHESARLGHVFPGNSQWPMGLFSTRALALRPMGRWRGLQVAWLSR
ncbi:unnamed protein product [Effrenium voratum]|nr:unnamed protein product [Effrenium voratum]